MCFLCRLLISNCHSLVRPSVGQTFCTILQINISSAHKCGACAVATECLIKFPLVFSVCRRCAAVAAVQVLQRSRICPALLSIYHLLCASCSPHQPVLRLQLPLIPCGAKECWSAHAFLRWLFGIYIHLLLFVGAGLEAYLISPKLKKAKLLSVSGYCRNHTALHLMRKKARTDPIS